MVRKQVIKQSVNVKVHIGDKKKKGGRRRKKGGGSSGGGNSLPQPIHAFTPIYIQSGQPTEADNPLHRAIKELHEKVDKKHAETPVNPLLKMVANEGKGNIAEHKQIQTPAKKTPARRTSAFGDKIPSPSSHNHSVPPNTDEHWDILRNIQRDRYQHFSYSNPMHKIIDYDSDTTPNRSPPVTTRFRAPRRNDVWKVGDPMPHYNGGRKSLLRKSYEAQNAGKSVDR